MEGTKLCAVSLNQWAMDFENNTRRIIESIVQAKRIHGAKIRVGSSCEIPGISAEDHFLEPDTIFHSWQVLAKILEVTHTPPYNDILCAIGMPVSFRGSIYNCAVIVHNGNIVLIRPKSILSSRPLNRETRWFTSWSGVNDLMEFHLPDNIRELYGQQNTLIGNAILHTEDNYLIGVESVDEAKSPSPNSGELFLMGTHIVMCLGDFEYEYCDRDRLNFIKTITNRTGGVYLFSNPIGFDGTRSYFEGRSMVLCNGKCLSITGMFSLKEVDLAVATVDLTDIDNYRSCVPSRNVQASIFLKNSLRTVKIPGFFLRLPHIDTLSPSIPHKDPPEIEQLTKVPACYLWDYLRRSTASGYFLQLPGDIESSSVLAILSVMCKHVLNTYETLTGFNKKIMEDDLMRIIGKIPESPKEMLSKIVYTAYMGCKNTSEASLSRSNAIAEDFGSTHIHGGIDEICDAYLEAFVQTTGGEAPKYQTEGGGEDEDIALQTLQSRVRMVLSYISGQLLPMAYGRNGFLIVLSYSCLEQNLCGYITKYGLSSGDINPIGCISQSDLKNILHTMKDEYQSLHRILEEKCEINELKPINVDAETDLEITFEEIRMFAYYRKVEKYGPFSMFVSCSEVSDEPIEEIARKVKRFFILYGKNRHKLTTLTPILHMDSAGCDDNRYDLRPFLYNVHWTTQFNAIDELVSKIKASS